MPGQLPEGKLLSLYQTTWRIAGHQLHQDNFTAAVRNLTQTIFASYSFHAQLDSLQPSQAAPVILNGQTGRFIDLQLVFLPPRDLTGVLSF